MIKLKTLLLENYEVTDLRDSAWIPDQYDVKDKDRVMVNIVGNKIYLYRWGHGNKIEWADLRKIVSGNLNDMMSLTPEGSLILPNRVGGDSTWEGARNLYTKGTKEWPEVLLGAGVITPDTKVYIGNWAGSRGTFVGRAGKLVKMDLIKLPSKIVFYHGTDSTRLEKIKQEGLSPRPKEERIWKSDVLKHHPEWRERAIYLTIDKGQADYYSKKAVNVMRRNRYTNVKKVILKITIPQKFYRRLLPDDDYLMRQLIQIGITWLDSLKEFSQVAYLGSIPPEWIEVESMGDTGKWAYPDVDVKETL